MDVRLKIGRYTGEIRDIPAPEAYQMIADGRAEDPRQDELNPADKKPEKHANKKR